MPWIKSCLCHQEKKKSPAISPPIHLLLKGENVAPIGPSHAFRCKTFKKPRPCHLCHQPILNEGSCCRVCKYVCHKVCESKEAAQRYTDTSWQIFRSDQVKTNRTIQTQTQGPGDHYAQIDVRRLNGSTNKTSANGDALKTVLHSHDDGTLKHSNLNKMITSNQPPTFADALTTQPRLSSKPPPPGGGGGMDLSYVTERIISLWFSPAATSHSYRQNQRQVAHMLRNKHGDNYKIFNLTEPKRALRTEHRHVKEAGWACDLAPPLERLCSLCKDIETWLNADERRIAVVHARGGSREKLGVVVAAYMHYSNICGSAEQALDRFAMRRFLEDTVGPLTLPSNKRFLEDTVGPLTLPSNKRYVDYFAGLLSHNIRINSAPLYLTHVTVVGTPVFQHGGCRAFLKLYEGHTPVYTSGIYSVTAGMNQFTVNVAGERRGGLQLRGDILVKCYHRTEVGRESVFACQFHTCAVSDHTLVFARQDLDGACNDGRFPADGAVELHFSSGPEGRHPLPAPTPAVPFVLADDQVTRANSPIHFDEYDDDSDSDDVNHTFGPLDGSIYATIAKKADLSPGAVSSPLTVSMDSGISSAGHQQNVNTAASGSPPLTDHPSPLTPAEQHRELDELLTDMMLTVQSIPDLKPDNDFGLENVRYIDDPAEAEERNIPYHARQDSRPFSYGVGSGMIGESRGLSSPQLVRKASVNKSSGDTLRRVQTQVRPDFSETAPRARDPIDDVFAVGALNARPLKREFREEFYKEESRRYDPLKRSLTDNALGLRPNHSNRFYDDENLSPPGAFRNATKSPDFHETYTTNGQTWLQRQQQKLKERRDNQLREERQPHETRLMSELRTVQSRHMRPTASHRLDGYTSDTTAFADDDDDYTVPLHVHTMHKNGGATNGTSSNYSTLKSTFSTSSTTATSPKERPFVSVKRAHERYAQSAESPHAILTSNPMGQIVRGPSRGGVDQVDAGLLSLYREEQWRSEAEATSPSHSSSPRPQTPAFPVHARTPYLNAAQPTTPTSSVQFVDVQQTSERLPPKSPTTLRRLSCPTPNKLTKKWSLSPERKDRPTSPFDDSTSGNEYAHAPAHRSASSDDYRQQSSPKSPNYNGSSSPTIYYGNSRRSSVNSSNEAPHEVPAAHVKFVRDTSKFWYKPTISREEAIGMLRNQPAGTFVVRDSNSFPGAFGMAVRVSHVPPSLQSRSPPGGATAAPDELIRHFLIEPTSRGVRLKGIQNEPVFSSLSALVYQHSITQMALPCRLILPEADLGRAASAAVLMHSPARELLIHGAACNVVYLSTLDMESLTGPEAIRKAVAALVAPQAHATLPDTAVVHFKVTGQGVTLTDNRRKLFFRKHYPIGTVSHCGLDPEEHRWTVEQEGSNVKSQNRIFGFVARKPNVSNCDNQCHLFAELEPEQPATAIVNFVNKVLSSNGYKPNIV